MEILLENRKCHIFEFGVKPSPTVFLGISNRESELSDICGYLENSGISCTLFAFEASDWNRDFSPWEMNVDDTFFHGGGKATLRWLENAAIPYAKELFPSSHLLISGYSLSGLFALWAFYETGLFEAAACCSGSLWFDRWIDYAKSKTAPAGSIVYLSLGGKEANSPNPVMASIAMQYKLQADILKLDKNIAKTVFELNSGGHFANPPKRIAKGIVWMAENISK